jgi:CBS-domain-containing membrane protein
MGSFGASIFLVMAAPDLPFAQPRSVLAGHFLASAIGLVCFHFIGESWLVMGFALGLTTITMLFFRVAHPPAGSNPVAIFLTGPDWIFLFTPTLAGALIIVTLGVVYNNLWRGRSYPKYW